MRERAGPASLDVAAWPLTGAGDEVVETPIAALSPDLPLTAVSIPNPHLIAFVDADDEALLVQLGERCEAAPDWLPNRANLSFVTVRGPAAARGHLKSLAVWVSYDGGHSWRRVTVRTDASGKRSVTLTHPARPGTVSFKAALADTESNTYAGTIYNAYRTVR